MPPDCPPNILTGPLFAKMLVSPRKTASKLPPVPGLEELPTEPLWEVLMVIPPPTPVAIKESALKVSRPQTSPVFFVAFPMI